MAGEQCVVGNDNAYLGQLCPLGGASRAGFLSHRDSTPRQLASITFLLGGRFPAPPRRRKRTPATASDSSLGCCYTGCRRGNGALPATDRGAAKLEREPDI
ncbi:hypothetical protein GN956_G2631 [Arapaima gigas]